VATTANLTMKTYENHVLILNTIFFQHQIKLNKHQQQTLHQGEIADS